MHLLLTDRLTCPRCGPSFGLILRADRLEDRRVHRGGLGCPNCREVYPVESGLGDLRPPPRATPEEEAHGTEPGDEELLRAQALLSVTEGPGHLLLLGEATRFGPGLARRIPAVEVVSAHQGTPPPAEGAVGSRLRVGSRLPLRDHAMRGVLLEGPRVDRGILREAARVLAPGHHLVVLEAPEGAAEALMAAGLTVKLQESGVVVAGR